MLIAGPHCSDSPNCNAVEEGEPGEDEGQHHHHRLCNEQQAALVDAIGNHSTKQRDEEEWNLSREANDAKPESGAGESEDEPATGYVLHPAADVGGEIAHPEEAEVGVA